MQIYQIEIEYQKANTRMVSVTLLQALLSVLIEGSKGALRLRTEGRSMVRGAPPQWIKAATTFSMEFQENRLYLQSPTLYEAAPEVFEQNDWFPELNSGQTSLDYFQESLSVAINQTLSQNETRNPDVEDLLYDKPLLEVFCGFRHVFTQGVGKIRFVQENGHQITPETITAIKELVKTIPLPCQVKIAGKLELIRIQDRFFKLITAKDVPALKGIVKPITPKEAKALLNKNVLVSGPAYFTNSGDILRVEAEQITIAEEKDLALWGELPLPASRQSNINQNQGLPEKKTNTKPKTITTTTFNKWPGNERNEELAEWRERLS